MTLIACCPSTPVPNESWENDSNSGMIPSSLSSGKEKTAVRRVLLVEDDDVLRGNYETLLSAHRFLVTGCGSKSEALGAFAKEYFDVVILDVALAQEYEAGFELCHNFRAKNRNIPIIFLTERTEDHDRISGLRLGADDFLTKTISGVYLAARINALIRRVETLTAGESGLRPATPRGEDSSSSLRIDDRLSRAYCRGSALELSLTQFWILKDLVEHRSEVRSISDLMRAAHVTVQPNTIVVQIKAIREQFQIISSDFACIKSERARGYRWVEE
jgi:two-component system, OmpR family, response regulator